MADDGGGSESDSDSPQPERRAARKRKGGKRKKGALTSTPEEVGVGERLTRDPLRPSSRSEAKTRKSAVSGKLVSYRDTPYAKARLFWRTSDVFAMAFADTSKTYHEVFRGVLVPRVFPDAPPRVMLRVGTVVETDCEEMRYGVVVSILYYVQASKALLTLLGVRLGEEEGQEIAGMRWTNLMDDVVTPGALVRVVGDVRESEPQREMLVDTLKNWQYGYVAAALEDWEKMSHDDRGTKWKARVADVLVRQKILANRAAARRERGEESDDEEDVESMSLAKGEEEEEHARLVKKYMGQKWPPAWAPSMKKTAKVFLSMGVEAEPPESADVNAETKKKPKKQATRKRKKSEDDDDEDEDEDEEDESESSSSGDEEPPKPKRRVETQRRKSSDKVATSRGKTESKPKESVPGDIGPRLLQLEQNTKQFSLQVRQLTKDIDSDLSEIAAGVQSLRELVDVQIFEGTFSLPV